MAANRKLQFSIIFSLVLIGIVTVPVYAAKVIETTKEVNVKKELLAKTLSDLRNYKELFPQFIKSVELKQDPNYAKFTINAQGSTYVADVKSSIHPDGSFVIEVLAGDIKGTKMITTLTERVSFDGKTPDGATTVKTKLILETNWMVSLALWFVGTDQIQKAIGDGFYNVGEYVKVKYPQETIKTSPKLEAAKVLEPAKEALKPQITSSQNQQTKPQTNLQSSIETKDSKSQIQTNPSIFAKTSKSSYSSGDQIIVFGTVNEVQKNIAVTVLITRPDGETVTISQTDVSQNGKFAETFKADGPLWNMNGIYTVSVKYGILGYQTTLEFTNKMTDLQTNTQPIVIWAENLTPGSTVIELKGQSNVGTTSIPITISVTNPIGNIVAVDRITPNPNGSFMTQIKIGGHLWKQDGAYIIKAQQGDSVNTNKIAKIQVDIANGAVVSSSSIFVKTDKSSYSDGEIIRVSGQVNEVFSGIPASLRVIAPNGLVITLEQIDIGADKTFSVEITAGGNLWRSAGTYTIEVSYGTTSQNTATASTYFEFTTAKNYQSKSSDSSLSITIDKLEYLQNEPIYVSVSVSEIIPNENLIINLIDPQGNSVSSTIVTEHGLKYSKGTTTSFYPVDNKWRNTGTFTIIAKYGNNSISKSIEIK